MTEADPTSKSWTLFPDVVPAPRVVGRRHGETAMSLLVRLGVANRMRDVRHLLKSTPHLRIGWIKNREGRIEVASRLSGFDVKEIAAATPVRMTGSHINVNNVVFNRAGTLPGRACPACIENDLDEFMCEFEAVRPYRRGWWQVPAVSTCPWHRTALETACGNCGQPLDERIPARQCRCGMLMLRKAQLTSESCAHDAWLLGRLGLGSAVDFPLLDALPLDVAAELCRVLGAAIRGERLRGARTETALSLAETRSTGWLTLQGGPAELEQVFDRIIARDRADGSVCKTSYSGLHRFLTLNRTSTLDWLRDLMLAHVKANVGLSGSRARLFGATVVDGKMISLTQGAKLLGVSKEPLSRLLLAVDPDFVKAERGPTLLSQAQLTAARKAIDGSVRSPEAKRVLGFDKIDMRFAIDTGLLNYVLPPTRTSLGLVCRQGVRTLNRTFCKPPFHDGAGLLDTAALSRSAGVTRTEVMLAVARGYLEPVGRRHGVAGYPALLFALSAATNLRITLRNQVSKFRAHAELGWMPRTISALQERGLMEDSGFKNVDLAALARFRADYASAEEAVVWFAQPPASLWALHFLLRQQCGEPIITGSGITAFWNRSEMFAKLGPLLRADAKSDAIGFGFAV